MSDAENLFTTLASCNVLARQTIAESLGLPLSLIQDFVHGHCCLDEDLVSKIATALTVTE